MSDLLPQAILQTVAALTWFGRGFWRLHPAWTFYILCAATQSWMMVAAGWERSLGVWCAFGPVLLVGMIDSVLELFLKLSHLYQRFQRDRWKWLAGPAVFGALLGLLLIWPRLGRPSDYYRFLLFLAYPVVTTVCSAVLLLGWIASTPVRLPQNIRRHLQLMTIYVAVSTLAYLRYFRPDAQEIIRTILIFVPTLLLLIWPFVLTTNADPDDSDESNLPESTLEQIQDFLKRLLR